MNAFLTKQTSPQEKASLRAFGSIWGGGKTLIFKQITSLKTLFLLLFFLCAIPLISQAQDNFVCTADTVIGGIRYSINRNSGTATAYGISGDGAITQIKIPPTLTIPSYPPIPISYFITVKKIADSAFYNKTAIKYLELPNTIDTIGNDAFNNMVNLERIARVHRDGRVDSARCYGLLDSIRYIGDRAFKNLKTLNGALILGTHGLSIGLGNNVFDNCENLKDALIFGVNEQTIREKNIFSRCYNLHYISFGDSYTTYLTYAVNRWNFVAGVGSKTRIYRDNSQKSDIAITGFDYTTNNWNSDFMYANDTLKAGEGYFLWVFKEDTLGNQVASDSTMVNMLFYANANANAQYFSTAQSVGGSADNIGSVNQSDSLNGKWYAFGNPFRSSMKVSDIINKPYGSVTGNNYEVQGNVLYTYDRYNKKWETRGDGEVIYPGEGFMFADGSAFTSFTNSFMWTFYNPDSVGYNALLGKNFTLKKGESYGIRFTATSNGFSADMFAKQVNDAQDGFDQKDAYALFGNNEDLVEPYFVVDGRQIIHNRYNSDNYTCAVNFHSQKSGVAELSVSDVPEGTTVSIVDLAMNTETILENEPYQIDIEAGENSGRYQIKINKGSVSLPQTIQNEANISIWNNNKEIFIKGENLQRVEVYNTLGQMVYQKDISGESYNFTLSNKGAYIVKTATNNGTKTKKIIVK